MPGLLTSFKSTALFNYLAPDLSGAIFLVRPKRTHERVSTSHRTQLWAISSLQPCKKVHGPSTVTGPAEGLVSSTVPKI
jgi:hypothetical protein